MNFKQLKITALSIWWGAFTFYAGIVIPLGMKVLGSHTEMGFITQKVTIYINIFSLIIFVFYAYCIKNQEFTKNIFLEEIVAISLIGFQLLLFLLHNYQTNLLDFENHKIINYNNFYFLHRIYLIVETLIWLVVSFLMGNEMIKR
jgi:RsiW-degrading membrane proteinase PrsW (M82 family)